MFMQTLKLQEVSIKRFPQPEGKAIRFHRQVLEANSSMAVIGRSAQFKLRNLY